MASRLTAKGRQRRASESLHALDVLEFDQVLELVAREAFSEAGAARLLRSTPLSDRDVADRELESVDELRGLLEAEGWQPARLPRADRPLERLRAGAAALDAEDLLSCAAVLAGARDARRALFSRVREGGRPTELVSRLWADRELEERIVEAFDEAGGVSDRASPELRRIRRQLNDDRGRLVERLTRYARELPERVRVEDASVTVRGGRYCIPIRREGKSVVGGLVHDASGSRQTLFVEPPLAIEPMNEIRELEVAERREVARVLEALTEALARHLPRLTAAYEALVELDTLRARAVFALRLGGSRPRLPDRGGALRIASGRHPLLAVRGGEVVPFDLDLDEDERVLLLTGPNAGGKTVLLKSIGLTAALAQSGVIPPVGEGSSLPWFGRIFAVIGDEQSIEASLSTFGAQARNLAEILERAGDGDLVLIDEIGSATDPAEGSALAAATLATLAPRARLTVATTHLGELKSLAEEDASVVNASLEFDSERLEPTYRLRRDRPGRSYALEIAARLGVPEDVLADARRRLDAGHRSLDDLLARIEEEQRAAEAQRRELERREGDLVGREGALEARERALETRETELEGELRAEFERALLETRDEVEAAIARLESELRAPPDAGEEAVRSPKRAARDAVERPLRQSAARREPATAREGRTGREGAPEPGDSVRWEGSARPGRLLEVRSGRGVVELDGVRLTVPLETLERVPGEEPATAAGEQPARPARPFAAGSEAASGIPDLEPRTEVDLRGLRADEVEGALLPAVDGALVAGLPTLRIIHGKGTGTLRNVVRALLDSDPRISAYRAGEAREGGTGVTVIEFE